MSFFIGENNFLSGFDINSLSSNESDYQSRDNIKKKVGTILPYKHIINVEGSHIEVGVFHSGATNEQLEKINTVINDTFKVCQKYKITPNDTEISFRMFLFEDHGQYVSTKKNIYNNYSTEKTQDTSAALSDVLVYRDLNNKFPSDFDTFDKVDYLSLAHEFVHCIQNLIKKNNSAVLSVPAYEGSAEAIACEALYGRNQKASLHCASMIIDGIKTIKSNNIELNDIYFNIDSDISKAVENPYTTGIVMFNFLSERHPELIAQLFEYFLDGNMQKGFALAKKINCVNCSGEFINWINSFPEFDQHSLDNIISNDIL